MIRHDFTLLLDPDTTVATVPAVHLTACRVERSVGLDSLVATASVTGLWGNCSTPLGNERPPVSLLSGPFGTRVDSNAR